MSQFIHPPKDDPFKFNPHWQQVQAALDEITRARKENITAAQPTPPTHWHTCPYCEQMHAGDIITNTLPALAALITAAQNALQHARDLLAAETDPQKRADLQTQVTHLEFKLRRAKEGIYDAPAATQHGKR